MYPDTLYTPCRRPRAFKGDVCCLLLQDRDLTETCVGVGETEFITHSNFHNEGTVDLHSLFLLLSLCWGLPQIT
jgi:hypothetical protein